MAGKMFNLLTILVTLMGLASAQTQTTASGSTVSAGITTMGGSADMLSTAAASTATPPSGAVNTGAASSMSNHPHHNQNTTPAAAAAVAATGPKIKFGLPTASNANPVRNAGRRPSQPGLRKLTIVVGLVTYGLILL